MSNPRDTERSRLGAIAPAAFLVGVALFALLGHAFFFGDPTDPADWKDAARHAQTMLLDGEQIRVHPTWSDAPFPYLQSVGLRIDRKRTLIPEDLVDATGFVVIAEKGRRREALDAMPVEVTASDIQDFGSVEVFRITPPDIDAPYVLREALDKAVVERRKGKASAACKKWSANERRWDCKRREKWLYVADEMREVGDEPRRCIYAPPVGKGSTLVLTWKDVSLGESFRLRSGLDLRAARSARGEDVSVRLFIGADEVVTRQIAHNDASWHLDTVKTTSGEVADVRVEIDATSSHERFFCFDGFVWNE